MSFGLKILTLLLYAAQRTIKKGYELIQYIQIKCFLKILMDKIDHSS